MINRATVLLLTFLCFVVPANAQQRELDREFLDAVQERDIPRINQLLSKGANVNAREPINGYFALQYAINWPDINLVKLLLDKGANINISDTSGNTALTEVAARGGPENAEIAKLLIARGANIHANNDAAIFGAAKYAAPEVVRLLIAKGARVDLRDKESDGNTVLLEAASGTSVEKIEMLLVAGADIKTTNNNGQTALMMASRLDHRIRPDDRLPMIELLLKKGSDINAKDKHGKTALLLSVDQYMSEAGGFISHPEVVKLLLERGADVQAADERGDNALLIALRVWEGNAEIPRVLIEKGINVNAQNKEGTTALMVAADKGKLPETQLLIAKGASADLKNKDGATALDVAVESGRSDIAKLLFAKGVISKVRYNSESELTKAVVNSALLRGASSFNLDEVKKQIALGADLHTRSRRGDTALMLAIDNSYGRATVPVFLIEQGSDVNAVNENGSTVLMIAVERNSDELVQILIDKKAKVYVRNKEGRTALHIAAAGLQQKIIRILLAAKPEVTASSAGVDVRRIDVNERDAAGMTPLILAANNGSFVPTETMELLLEKGAEIDAQDPKGNTALITSAANGSLSGVEFLITKGAAVNVKNSQGQTALTLARTIHSNNKFSNAAELERRIVALLVSAGAK